MQMLESGAKHKELEELNGSANIRGGIGQASFLGKRNINNSILLADLIPPTIDPDYRFCLYRVCTLSL